MTDKNTCTTVSALGNSSGHKIASVSLHRVVQPLKNKKWRNAGMAFAEYPSYIVAIATDQGATGYSTLDTMPVSTAGWQLQSANVADLAAAVIGLDPIDIGVAVQRMRRSSFAPSVSAFAAMEMAIHDLAATVLGLPLGRLFGGAIRDRIDVTRMISIGTPDEMAAQAGALVARGFRFVKFKVAGTRDDVDRMKAIREAVGWGTRLAIDLNGGYRTAKEAIAQVELLVKADVDIEIVEQPLGTDDLEGLRVMRRALPVKIEADQTVTSMKVLRQLIDMEAIDAVNLRFSHVGGLRGMQFAAQYCAQHNIGVRIAAYGSALASAQALHMASTLDTLHFGMDVAEFEQFEIDPFSGLEVENGTVAVPTSTGSGAIGDLSGYPADAVFS